MKLIVDWWNGGKWQWRYLHAAYHLWFDYGPAFDSKSAAERYVSNESDHLCR